RDRVPAYADVPIRNETPAALGEQLAACVAGGYGAVKFHIINRDPDHIVEQVRAARAAIGPGVKLMVDIFRALEPREAREPRLPVPRPRPEFAPALWRRRFEY